MTYNGVIFCLKFQQKCFQGLKRFLIALFSSNNLNLF
jgi:hypothetical protein